MVLKLTESRVCQLHSKAILRLRGDLHRSGFETGKNGEATHLAGGSLGVHDRPIPLAADD